MKALKCEMNDCGRYIVNEESKQVFFNGKIITICEICDDGTYESPNNHVGGNHGTYNKVEKIKRKRRKEDR